MKLNKLFILSLVLLTLISCGNREEIEAAVTEAIENGELVLPPEEIQPTERINLIVNGSFEEGHGLTGNSWGVFSEITGWTANTDEIDAPIEIQTGNIGGLFPSAGRSKMELDSHNRDGFTESDSHVYQDLETVANEYYYFAFDYAPRKEGDTHTSDVEVYFDGELLGTIEGERIDENAAKRVHWTPYEFLVQAGTDLTRVEFRAIHDSDTLGGYIDNVTLYKAQ
jgi:hypothetical protein